MPWRRKWQPTPVYLPGKFNGQRNLAGYSPWGRKELDTAEQLSITRVSGIKYVYVVQPSPLSRTFSFTKRYLCPHKSIAGHPHLRQSLVPTSLLSVSMILMTSYKSALAFLYLFCWWTFIISFIASCLRSYFLKLAWYKQIKSGW